MKFLKLSIRRLFRATEKLKFNYYEVYVQREKAWYHYITDLLFSHLGLFLLCIAYALLGAFVMIALEEEVETIDYEAKLVRTKEIESTVEYLKSRFWQYSHDRVNFKEINKTTYREKVMEDLVTLKRFTVDSVNDFNYNGDTDWEKSWTFSKSLLFSITVMTTVGYGHIFPVTFEGKLFTIGYALIGIPLLLVFLNDIGAYMGRIVKFIYSRICCRWCRIRRRISELSKTDKYTGISRDHVGVELYMPTDLIQVPIVVNLIIMGAFLFIGAAVFNAWENWGFLPSFYFCFVTLTTIGFGDLVPDKAFLEAGETLYGSVKMIFTMTYVIFGIMLLSLALNLMQEQVMEKVHWIAAEIGMDGKKDEARVTEVVELVPEQEEKDQEEKAVPDDVQSTARSQISDDLGSVSDAEAPVDETPVGEDETLPPDEDDFRGEDSNTVEEENEEPWTMQNP